MQLFLEIQEWIRTYVETNAFVNILIRYKIEAFRLFGIYLMLYLPLELLKPAKTIQVKKLLLNLYYYPIFYFFTCLCIYFGRIEFLTKLTETPFFIKTVGSQIIQTIIALFIFDFFYYWYHRSLHTSFLWPQHQVHHSDTNLNVTTSWRHHISENLLIIPFTITSAKLIAVYAAAPEQTGNLWAFLTYAVCMVISLAGVFSHANIRIGFGRFNWLFTNPQIHRIHHSIEPQHFNKNFAAYFPIYDVIFGTYYAPKKDEYPDTGIEGCTIESLKELTIHPFREWFHLPEKSSKKEVSVAKT